MTMIIEIKGTYLIKIYGRMAKSPFFKSTLFLKTLFLKPQARLGTFASLKYKFQFLSVCFRPGPFCKNPFK